MYELKLYITGHSPASRDLTEELKTTLDVNIGGKYSLQVLDVSENAEAARADKVLATPTLIKTSPEPALRVVGNLGKSELVLAALGLRK